MKFIIAAAAAVKTAVGILDEQERQIEEPRAISLKNREAALFFAAAWFLRAIK